MQKVSLCDASTTAMPVVAKSVFFPLNEADVVDTTKSAGIKNVPCSARFRKKGENGLFYLLF